MHILASVATVLIPRREMLQGLLKQREENSLSHCYQAQLSLVSHSGTGFNRILMSNCLKVTEEFVTLFYNLLVIN